MRRAPVLKILQVNTADYGGGAEGVARGLHQAYRAAGHAAWMAVGQKWGDDPHTLVLSRRDGADAWGGFWWGLQDLLHPLVGRVRGGGRLSTWLDRIARRWTFCEPLGIEDFSFPGTRRLLDLPPQRPDIVHCHNLHGGGIGAYFDLRALPRLSQQVPVVLTLHDAWLLSGHCAHSFACERWRSGCGRCPDLAIPPAVQHDATAFNWRRKRRIFEHSALHIATPCDWLMRKVEASILGPSISSRRVIPNGVDLNIFHAADKATARRVLGLDPSVPTVLFAAYGIKHNRFKDYPSLHAAIRLIAEWCPESPLRVIALGEDAPPERIGRVEFVFVPHQRRLETVARYYQAADVYVQPARVDTFPNTVLEALACGTPVVATAVGGIPEQVRDVGASEAPTGILVEPGSAPQMAHALRALLEDESFRHRLGANAARDARRRFDQRLQAAAYLTWYQELLDGGRRAPAIVPTNPQPGCWAERPHPRPTQLRSRSRGRTR